MFLSNKTRLGGSRKIKEVFLMTYIEIKWSSMWCAGLLDVKPGFVSQLRHQKEIGKKNISSAISSQQISGKNSVKEIKLHIHT